MVLQTHNLSKRYGSQWALKDVNINVEKGDIYGFVGENGSGKTTVIRLICGLISATQGTFTLFGADGKSKEILSARKKIGAIVETPSIYLNMTATENLKMQLGVLGVKEKSREKIEKVLSRVGLADMLNSKKIASNFSLGMRQRLGLAMALLGEPEFIILDEPMNGLDPAGIVEIRELILKLNRENGITFLISSHILSELSLVATKYGIISKGKIVKEITAKGLEKECKPSVTIEIKQSNELLFRFLSANYDCVETVANGVKVTGDISLNELFGKISKEGFEIVKVNTFVSTIEDYYLSLMGGNENA